MSEEREVEPWHQKGWLVFVLLFFLYPIGLIFLWIKKSFSTMTKVICTVVFGLFFLVVISGGSEGPSQKAASTEPNVVEKVEQAVPAEPEISDITFEEVDGKFGSQGNLSDLQKDEFWKNYKGKCVEWTGELVHVDEGLLGGIVLGFKHRGDTLTYDVLVDAPASAKELALSYQINSSYKYKARLKNYGGAVVPISADLGCQ